MVQVWTPARAPLDSTGQLASLPPSADEGRPVEALRGKGRLSSAHMERTLDRTGLGAGRADGGQDEIGTEVDVESGAIRTSISGSRSPSRVASPSPMPATSPIPTPTPTSTGQGRGEDGHWESQPPLPPIAGHGVRSGSPGRGSPDHRQHQDQGLVEPSMELKRAWKVKAVERLATLSKKSATPPSQPPPPVPPPPLQRSDSDLSTSSVFSLEDLKRRIAERAQMTVVMVQRRKAAGRLAQQQQQASMLAPPPPSPQHTHHGEGGPTTVPGQTRPGPPPPAVPRRARSRSLTLKPVTGGAEAFSGRRSSSSSDPSSKRRSSRRYSDERLVARLVPPPVPDEAPDGGERLTQGAAVYERRRSAANSFLDVNGNLSYASRKSLRRGSYDGRPVERAPRPAETGRAARTAAASDSSAVSAPPSAGEGRRRGSVDAGTARRLSGGGDAVGPAVERALPLGRRRRSRAPASLTEDISRFASIREKRISGLSRFRRAAKVVLLCVSMCRKSYLRAEQEKEAYMSFETSSNFLGGQRLLFDPAYFKADRQQRLSEETKRILNLPPASRTDDLIKYVQIALRNIRAFAEYPKRMQHMLCRVGWLEEYETKRAILRQGHLPHAFYFILSGEVVVTVLDTAKGKRVAETVAILKRGESFGELAILNRTRRASTVISQDRVELLCISVEDFEDIFMLSGGIKRVNDPDQHAFLTSLTCLKHWPVHLIEKHPNDCRFHFFKDGNVLIKDSLFSEWIYIIKSGSCSVLKKLKRVAPFIPSRLKRKTSPLGRGSAAAQALPSAAASVSSGESPTASPSKKIKQRRHRRSLTWPGLARRSSTAAAGPAAAAGDRDLRPGDPRPSARSNAPGDPSAVLSKLGKRTSHGAGKRAVYLATSRDDGAMGHPDPLDSDGDRSSDDELSEEPTIPFIQRRREFHSDLDNSRLMTEKTEADMDPMFVVVQVLTKGAVFGLTGVVFSDQPSLSLVSNGAECILINKKFYLEHATEETLRGLRKEEVPYPSEQELKNKLQQYMNWNAYRHHTFYTTLYESRDHKTERVTVLKPMLFR